MTNPGIVQVIDISVREFLGGLVLIFAGFAVLGAVGSLVGRWLRWLDGGRCWTGKREFKRRGPFPFMPFSSMSGAWSLVMERFIGSCDMTDGSRGSAPVQRAALIVGSAACAREASSWLGSRSSCCFL